MFDVYYSVRCGDELILMLDGKTKPVEIITSEDEETNMKSQRDLKVRFDEDSRGNCTYI